MDSRNQSTDLFTLASVPAAVTPFILIGVFVFIIDRAYEFHAVVNVLLFAGLNALAYLIIPRALLFGASHILLSVILFWTVARLSGDLVWAVFWAMLYFSIGSYSLYRYLVSTVSGDLDDQDDPVIARAPRPSSISAPKPKKEILKHRKVGFCQGWNGGDSNTRSTHHLYRCGRCGVAGCGDAWCEKRNFEGSKCMTCQCSASKEIW